MRKKRKARVRVPVPVTIRERISVRRMTLRNRKEVRLKSKNPIRRRAKRTTTTRKKIRWKTELWRVSRKMLLRMRNNCRQM